MTERRRMTRLVWIHTTVVVLVVIIVGGLIFYASSKKLETLKSQMASLKEQQATMEAKRDELPNIEKRLPELLAQSRRITLLMPGNPAQKELVAFLQDNAKKANGDVVLIKMEPPRDLEVAAKSEKVRTAEEKKLDNATLEKTKVIATTCVIRGGFENILAFTENLKRSNRYFRIDHIKAPAQTGGTDFDPRTSLTYELSGEMYYTTAKATIADQFSELRDLLEHALGTAAVETPVPEEETLIEVEAGGSGGAARTEGEEVPTG